MAQYNLEMNDLDQLIAGFFNHENQLDQASLQASNPSLNLPASWEMQLDGAEYLAPASRGTFVPPGFIVPSVNLGPAAPSQQIDPELLKEAQRPATAPSKQGRGKGKAPTKNPASAPKEKRPPAPRKKIDRGPFARPTELSYSAETLTQEAQTQINDHLRAATTTRSYAGHVKAAKTWLENYQQNRSINNPDLGDAFDVLSDRSATAIRLHWASRIKEVSFPTIEGSRSGLRAYFREKFPDQSYVEEFRFLNGRWEGNPVYYGLNQDLYTAYKRDHLRSKTPKQSSPLLLPALTHLMQYIDAQLAKERDPQTYAELMFASAYITLGWWLMAQMEECLQLKEMDFIEHGQDPNYPGQDMAIMVLTFRKTNQMDPFDSNRYQMHEPMDENKKPVWALPRLLRWRQFVTEKTHIPHAGLHMLLPAISSGGKIDLEQAMPQRSWMAIFDRLCQDLGLNDKHPNSTFSSHSLRRGGAQWRFNYAPARWGLQVIRWWGGWAPGEATGTLMRYLLEERAKIDTYHGDIMNPLLDPARQVVQSDGQNGLVSKVGDITRLETRMARKLEGVVARLMADMGEEMDRTRAMVREFTTRMYADPDEQSDVERERHQQILQAIANMQIQVDSQQRSLCAATSAATTIVGTNGWTPPGFNDLISPPSASVQVPNHSPNVRIPVVPSTTLFRAAITEVEGPKTLRLRYSGDVITGERPPIPKTRTVRSYVLQWFQGGQHVQHPYPLREWPREWLHNKTKEDQQVWVLWRNREVFGMGYENANEGSTVFTEEGFARFEAGYPATTVTGVLSAIRKDLQTAGKIKSRQRSPKSPE